jgi:hypothetical protein
MRDVLSDEVLRIAGSDLPPLSGGSNLFGRVVYLGEEKRLLCRACGVGGFSAETRKHC